MSYDDGKLCPTCGSPDPNRHPAVAFEGEVEVCRDPFHPITGETLDDAMIDELHASGAISSLSRTIAKRQMRGPRVGASAYEERREREYCAELINARNAAKDGAK